MLRALSNKQYSGHHKATEVDGDLRTPRIEIWRKKCGQVQLEEDGGRSTRQSWMETSGLGLVNDLLDHSHTVTVNLVLITLIKVKCSIIHLLVRLQISPYGIHYTSLYKLLCFLPISKHSRSAASNALTLAQEKVSSSTS